MKPIESLPLDVWFPIFQYLNIGDLYRLSQSFGGSSKSVVPSMAKSRAIKIIYEGLILNVQIPRVVVVGDALRERLMITPYDGGRRTKISYPYFADNVDFIPSFSLSSCSSALEMTLSATAKCFDLSYDPGVHGGEPFALSSIEVQLTNPARTPPFVQLDYHAVEKATNTVDEVYHHERHKSRTITQKLQLTAALWTWIDSLLPPDGGWNGKFAPTEVWKTQPLPREWFDSLGLGQVHVEAAFDKKGSIYRTPEEWIRWGSDVQYMSVSFENLKLPTSPSLLKLFPKEVLEGLPK